MFQNCLDTTQIILWGWQGNFTYASISSMYIVSPNSHQHLGFSDFLLFDNLVIWCFLPIALYFWLQPQLSYFSYV